MNNKQPIKLNRVATIINAVLGLAFCIACVTILQFNYPIWGTVLTMLPLGLIFVSIIYAVIVESKYKATKALPYYLAFGFAIGGGIALITLLSLTLPRMPYLYIVCILPTIGMHIPYLILKSNGNEVQSLRTATTQPSVAPIKHAKFSKVLSITVVTLTVVAFIMLIVLSSAWLSAIPVKEYKADELYNMVWYSHYLMPWLIIVASFITVMAVLIIIRKPNKKLTTLLLGVLVGLGTLFSVLYGYGYAPTAMLLFGLIFLYTIAAFTTCIVVLTILNISKNSKFFDE